jgi:hypothetical protein
MSCAGALKHIANKRLFFEVIESIDFIEIIVASEYLDTLDNLASSLPQPYSSGQ